MSIMGLDQSYTGTGIVVIQDGEITCRLVTTDVNSENPFDKFERARIIANDIVASAAYHDVKKIVIEGLAFAGTGNATRDLGGLQYIIIDSLIHAGYSRADICILPPNTLKKYATGNGKAKKIDMYESLPDNAKPMISQYLKTKGRYDITDAYFLAKYGEEHLNNDTTGNST